MRKIPNFENYSITENGIVFSHLRNKFKKHFYLKNGYQMVSLTKDKRQKNYSTHYLMAITYIGEKPSSNHQVMHLDGNKKTTLLPI